MKQWIGDYIRAQKAAHDSIPAEAVSQISNLIKNDVLRREFSKAAAARSKMFGPKVFELGLGSVLREYQK